MINEDKMNITRALSGYKEKLDAVMEKYQGRYSMMKAKAKDGFTVLELMIVCATIGILTAIVAPLVLQAVKKQYEEDITPQVRKEIRMQYMSALESEIEKAKNHSVLLASVEVRIMQLEDEKKKNNPMTGFYSQPKEKIEEWQRKYQTLVLKREMLQEYIRRNPKTSLAGAEVIAGTEDDGAPNMSIDRILEQEKTEKANASPEGTMSIPEEVKPDPEIAKLEAENKGLKGENDELRQYKVKYIAVQEGRDPLAASAVSQLEDRGYMLLSIEEYAKRAENFRGKKVRLIGEPVNAYVSDSIMTIRLKKDNKFVDCTAFDTKTIELNDVQAASLYNALQVMMEDKGFHSDEITVYAQGNGEDGLACQAVKIGEDNFYRLLR